VLAHLPKANAYYWRMHAAAELDLFFLKGPRIGIEIERDDDVIEGVGVEGPGASPLISGFPDSRRYAHSALGYISGYRATGLDAGARPILLVGIQWRVFEHHQAFCADFT
jgi:hypothetical protein